MKTEREFKTLFKKSVYRQKGFYLSLAAPMISGTPDAYVALPGYMPILLEAKFLGEIKREKFSKKVPFTEMQMLWIKSCHEVNPYSAMGLIGFIYNNKIHAVLVAHGTPMFYQISNCFLIDCSYATVSQESKLFNITELFRGVPIPRIIQPPKPLIESIYDTRGSTIPLAV